MCLLKLYGLAQVTNLGGGYLGQLFLGKSFGALKDDRPPPYVHHLDNAYLVWAIQGALPSVYKFMSVLPFRSIRDFLTAGDYVYDVRYPPSYPISFFHKKRQPKPVASCSWYGDMIVWRRRLLRLPSKLRSDLNTTLAIDQTHRWRYR